MLTVLEVRWLYSQTKLLWQHSEANFDIQVAKLIPSSASRKMISESFHCVRTIFSVAFKLLMWNF